MQIIRQRIAIVEFHLNRFDLEINKLVNERNKNQEKLKKLMFSRKKAYDSINSLFRAGEVDMSELLELKSVQGKKYRRIAELTLYIKDCQETLSALEIKILEHIKKKDFFVKKKEKLTMLLKLARVERFFHLEQLEENEIEEKIHENIHGKHH